MTTVLRQISQKDVHVFLNTLFIRWWLELLYRRTDAIYIMLLVIDIRYDIAVSFDVQISYIEHTSFGEIDIHLR